MRPPGSAFGTGATLRSAHISSKKSGPLLAQRQSLEMHVVHQHRVLWHTRAMMFLQEIESILDNPDEMADMYLANKEAALDAEAEQVCRLHSNLVIKMGQLDMHRWISLALTRA